MAGIVDFEYDFFDEYRAAVLSDLPTIEQLIRLDDEVANDVLLPRYAGPVDPVEWTDLERYYSRLFAGFVTERIDGIVDTAPIEENAERFHSFRRNIASLNGMLPGQRTARTDVISKPAETVLLKRLRRLGFDPSSLDISHVGGGSGIYLLELFVTAAQQQAVSDTELLSALLEEAALLGEMTQDGAMERLHRAVLMVSLWENQEEGLNRWLSNERVGILEMATATGKTVAGIAAIAECCGVLPDDANHEPRTDDANIMVVAHSNAILKQWEREIQEKLGLPMPSGEIGEKANTLSFTGGEIEFYTAQSLLPRYDRDLAETYDLVIYDEVHHYANEGGYGAAIDRPEYEAAMGLSATIGDEGGVKRSQLTELLAEVVYTYGVEDARRDGIIPEFDWTVHPTPLDPYERDEWEETTESISDQFKNIRRSSETKQLLRKLSVPFTELEDLGDFIRAHEAASMVFDEDKIPDEWGNLQATIHSRTWIRHRSQPKIENAIELAKEYLCDSDRPIKVVIFAMDIETADEIAAQVGDVTENVFRAHSQLEGSSRKNNERVQRNIDAFAECDNGVLVSPKMLDEGIDVPDAEVGINVAGTKTKLQLVQRMGRVLRRHGDQRPHFHHFIAIPDDNYIEGIDSKEYVQELNWVRELGETIGVQPVIEEAGVDSSLLARAEQRGNELWAQDLLNDLEVETVQGNVHLDELLEALTADATEILLDELWLQGDVVAQEEWETAMEELRRSDALSIEGLQRVWWLFPLYRERPADLDELLTGALGAMLEEEDTPDTIPDSVGKSSEPSEGSQDAGAETDASASEDIHVVPPLDPDSGEKAGTSTETTGQSQSVDASTDASQRSVDPQEASSDESTRKNATSVFGAEESPLQYIDDHEVLPSMETEVDDDLLTSVGRAGLLSNGYLHERPLEAYLEEREEPRFILASKQQPPEHSERAVPELAGYRAITAVTPTRIVCVVGDEPENEVFDVELEEVTNIESIRQGRLFWKHAALRVQTDTFSLEIPDGSDTDLQVVVEYIRRAVYKEKLSAVQHRLESIRDTQADKSNAELTAMLETVQQELQYALHWANTHGLDTLPADLTRQFVETSQDSLDAQSRDEDDEPDTAEDGSDETIATPARADLIDALQALKGELERLPKAPEMDARGKYSTHDYYEAFGTWGTALEAAGIDKKQGLIDELENLAIEIEEVPSTGQIDEHGTFSSGMYIAAFGSIDKARDAADFSSVSSTESEATHPTTGTATAESSDSQSDGPTQDELLAEIRRLDERDTLVPYGNDMDSHGKYKTYDCIQEFGSWDEALVTAGIDKEERLLDELRRLRDTLGHMPSTSEMNEHGTVSVNMYSKFFGSWTEATAKVADEPEAKTKKSGKSRDDEVLIGEESEALTWKDIPEYGRLPGPIAIRVTGSLETQSDRVAGRYRVEDLNGKEFDLKHWSKHSLNTNWESGHWYVVSEARGTVWESNGETKRMLDSTRDLKKNDCGHNRPTVDDIQ